MLQQKLTELKLNLLNYCLTIKNLINMESDELKTLWKILDDKIDNLNKINKKMILNSFAKTQQMKFNRIYYSKVFGSLIGPLGVLFFVYMYIKFYSFDWKTVIGIFSTFFFIVYQIVYSVKSMKILKSINLENDSLIESAKKIGTLRSIYYHFVKHSFWSVPLYFIGYLLVAWNSFVFDTKTIFLLCILLIVFLFYMVISLKKQQRRYDVLEKELLELDDYLK